MTLNRMANALLAYINTDIKGEERHVLIFVTYQVITILGSQ